MEPKDVWLSYCWNNHNRSILEKTSLCLYHCYWRSVHLSIASLHMSQSHLRIDWMAAGHAEDLQVCVLAVSFVHLRFTKQFDRLQLCIWKRAADALKELKRRTSSSCWTACCLALAMMPSSSWKRRSISVRRSRAFCCSLRMRSSCFLPCSSAMHGLCCHCWIRCGRIS